MLQKDLSYFTKFAYHSWNLYLISLSQTDWSLQVWHPRAVGFSNPNVKSYISGLYYLMFLLLSQTIIFALNFLLQKFSNIYKSWENSIIDPIYTSLSFNND